MYPSEGSAVLLIENYISALGAECDFNSISELVNACDESVSSFDSVKDILCHCVYLLDIYIS